MSSFILKIFAIVFMVFDHFGISYIRHFSYFNLIGRMSFPIFAFQISEGFIHTKNLKKYILRLFIFALISQIPFYLFLHKYNPALDNTLNIFFTLLLGLLCIIIYNYFINLKITKKIFGVEIKRIFGILIVLLVSYLGNLIHVDYGYWGILIIFIFYLFKKDKLAMVISYICLCIIKYISPLVSFGFHIEYIYLILSTIFPIIIILLYNGKQGLKLKYFMYLFYPLHLLALYLFI